MSFEGLVLGALIVTFTLLVIVYPLLRHPPQSDLSNARSEKARERLNVYYQRVLRNLRDLDEDFDLGKISVDDYAADRDAWMLRGVQALKALDDLKFQGDSLLNASDDSSLDQAINDAIETAVQKAKNG